MTPARTFAVALASTIAFGTMAASSVAAAYADEDTSSVSCSQQQTQVDKATAKMVSLTAKFAAHPTQKNLKAKKAQVQRVDRATARLEACLTGTTEEPTDD